MARLCPIPRCTPRSRVWTVCRRCVTRGRTNSRRMLQPHVDKTARELSLRPEQVRATAALLADGATVPFVARYRKEATGSLDEVAIAAIRDRLAQMEGLDHRRAVIIASLEERNLLT